MRPAAPERRGMQRRTNDDLAALAASASTGDENAFGTLLHELEPMIQGLANEASPRIHADDAIAIAHLVVWKTVLRHDTVQHWRQYLRTSIRGELQYELRTQTYAVRPPRKDRSPKCPRAALAWWHEVRLDAMPKYYALLDPALVVVPDATDVDTHRGGEMVRQLFGQFAARLTTRDRRLFLSQIMEPHVTLRQLSRELDVSASKLCRQMKVLRESFRLTLEQSPSWPLIAETFAV
jgi:hypothetical protein